MKNKMACEINIFDAMMMLRTAWRDVTATSVANFFHKAGFATQLCKGSDGFPNLTDANKDDNIPLALSLIHI